MIERLLAVLVTVFARIVTGVRGEWAGCLPEPRRGSILPITAAMAISC